MATLNQDQKNLLEWGLDILGVLVMGDILWTTVFGQPPLVQFFHDWIATLGTVGGMWLVWKMLRKNKALG